MFEVGEVVSLDTKYEQVIGTITRLINGVAEVRQLNYVTFNWPLKALKKDIIGNYLYG